MQFIQEIAKSHRIPRRPAHPFFVRHRPFQIQPFMIAPVLPGETLKAANLQVRAVTDPLKNRLTGWWLEHYLFYVPHQALTDVTTLEAMMLDPSATQSAVEMSVPSSRKNSLTTAV